jgi:hypothetical protein
VLAAFTETIDDTLDLRPLHPDTKSSTSRRPRFRHHRDPRRPALAGRPNTAALLVTGAGRDQQIRCRAQLRTQIRSGEHDILTDCRAQPPLHPDCARVRGDLISP